MGLVYAVANQKGGVGKTTTAVNVTACVAASGSQTLLVDLDPQCNATVALGGDRDLHPSSYDCLTAHVSVAEARAPAPPLPPPADPATSALPRRRPGPAPTPPRWCRQAPPSPAPRLSCRASR